MSALRQEVKEKFHLLDKETQRQVLNELNAETTASQKTLSWDEWLAWADETRAYLTAKYGDMNFNSVDALNEARDERMHRPLIRTL